MEQGPSPGVPGSVQPPSRSLVKPRSPHPDSCSLLFCAVADTDEQRGIFGPRSIHKVPSVEGCPCLFVQILPAQTLFDVFKGAILVLRKEDKCRFDEARHSKLFFTQKSAGLGLKKIYIFCFS